MTPKNTADAFYNGELEAELRRIGKGDVTFKADQDREKHMELVESLRREALYPHPACSHGCQARGTYKLCGNS